MSGLSRSVLATACIAEGLPSYGTKFELTHRLGTHLVERKLGVAAADGKKRASSDVPDIQMKRTKRPLNSYQRFMKSEMPNIKASGVTGLTDSMKELARRWRLAKQVGTSSEPLLLSDKQGEVKGLASVLEDLPPVEVNEALAAHGEPVSSSSSVNAERLASALVVYI